MKDSFEETSIRLRNMTSLYIVEEDRVLCLYRKGSRIADKKYIGTAGGHFEEKELNNPLACVLREMKEELGLLPEDVTDLRLRYITNRLKDSEIRQNYFYFGQLRSNRSLVSTEGDLKWIRFQDIPELDMPVSAKHMILHFLNTGRYNDLLYGGITQNNGTVFYPLEEF